MKFRTLLLGTLCQPFALEPIYVDEIESALLVISGGESDTDTAIDKARETIASQHPRLFAIAIGAREGQCDVVTAALLKEFGPTVNVEVP